MLYEDGPLDAAWDLVKDWTAASAEFARSGPQRLEGSDPRRSVRDVARDMLKLSRAGLEKRDKPGCKGRTEAAFLDVLDEIAASGQTPAEDLLELYHGAWKGNIARVFRDFPIEGNKTLQVTE